VSVDGVGVKRLLLDTLLSQINDRRSKNSTIAQGAP
jgi:hypothetical protein